MQGKSKSHTWSNWLHLGWRLKEGLGNVCVVEGTHLSYYKQLKMNLCAIELLGSKWCSHFAYWLQMESSVQITNHVLAYPWCSTCSTIGITAWKEPWIQECQGLIHLLTWDHSNCSYLLITLLYPRKSDHSWIWSWEKNKETIQTFVFYKFPTKIYFHITKTANIKNALVGGEEGEQREGVRKQESTNSKTRKDTETHFTS